MNKKEVVYQIPCQDCDSVYIGETGRSLGKRRGEHKYAVKTGDWKNGVAVHACMGWRTQGGLGRSGDPWVGTTLPEEMSPRSHLDKEDQQQLQSGLCPCLEPDLATILEHRTFPFPQIYRCHSAIINQYLSTSAYISLVLCMFSSFSWRRSTDRNILHCSCLSLCYAKLKKNLWITVCNISMNLYKICVHVDILVSKKTTAVETCHRTYSKETAYWNIPSLLPFSIT